jgi:hypothetical protein
LAKLEGLIGKTGGRTRTFYVEETLVDRGMARGVYLDLEEEVDLCELMVVAMMHSPLI